VSADREEGGGGEGGEGEWSDFVATPQDQDPDWPH
jgi:hypothetical protein